MPFKLEVGRYDSIDEAPTYHGSVYLTLDRMNLVRNGTQGGQTTIDIIMTDENGKTHTAIITANLLKSATAILEGFDGS
jgi:hypothetical protein